MSRTSEELAAWAEKAKMWKERVLKAQQDLEQGKCTEAEYWNISDASTAFAKEMFRALL